MSGKNLTIHVPLGIQILRDNGELIDEINDIDDECIVAHGGVGGNYKTFFQGQPGEATMINLDLKLLADIGFVYKSEIIIIMIYFILALLDIQMLVNQLFFQCFLVHNQQFHLFHLLLFILK
jgi:hypothetical protein